MRSDTKTRTIKGSSMVELGVICAALVPIILIFLDLSILMGGVYTNQTLCRTAARQASTDNPRDALKIANAVVKEANSQRGSSIDSFELVDVNSTISPRQLQMLGPFGGAVQGTVTVKTLVTIKPLIIQWLYPAGSRLRFQAEQTFPFTVQIHS